MMLGWDEIRLDYCSIHPIRRVLEGEYGLYSSID